MKMEIAYAFGALLCYGLGDLIYKRAAVAGLAAEKFLMGQAWFFCPAVLVYSIITGSLRFGRPPAWGGIAGLLMVVGFYAYFRSLRSGAVSIIAPVFRLNFIVTAAMAIALLHETLTSTMLGGFVLALLAAWLLLGGSSSRRSSQLHSSSTLMQAIIATVSVGAANVCHKLGLNDGAAPETMLCAQAVVFCGMFTLIVAIGYGTIQPPVGLIRHSLPAAVVLLAAFLFLLHGLKRGQASVIVPIAQMGFAISAPLGVVLFHEPRTLGKLIGISAAMGSLVMLAMAH